MATIQEQTIEVREGIGEIIPEGGTAADTMFTDEKIVSWIVASPSLTAAIVKGWEVKLAEWSSLVDVTDQAASRKLGDLMDHAERMIKYYRGKVSMGPNDSLTRSRTRVGKIVRRG